MAQFPSKKRLQLEEPEMGLIAPLLYGLPTLIISLTFESLRFSPNLSGERLGNRKEGDTSKEKVKVQVKVKKRLRSKKGKRKDETQKESRSFDSVQRHSQRCSISLKVVDST